MFLLTLSFALQENAKRLLAYKAKLIVFPRRNSKPKVLACFLLARFAALKHNKQGLI